MTKKMMCECCGAPATTTIRALPEHLVGTAESLKWAATSIRPMQVRVPLCCDCAAEGCVPDGYVVRYRIQATYTLTQCVTSDATGPETLGGYYGVLFESREEAGQAIAELEGDAESYGLGGMVLEVESI